LDLGFDLLVLVTWNFCFWGFRLTAVFGRFGLFLTPWAKVFFSKEAVGTAAAAAAEGDGKWVEFTVIPWALIDRLRASASWLASC